MGARTNFQLKDETGSVWLYSHWGGETKAADFARALRHAAPRWSEPSYSMRMIVSYLLSEEILSETGFGLGTEQIGEEHYEPLTADLVKQTVTYKNQTVSFSLFVGLFA